MLEATEFALLRRLAQEQAGSRAPSMVAALVRGGQIIWTGARGRVGDSPPTTDTQYRIGSITKSFVAALVLRLRDEGKLELTDRLDSYLPETQLGDLTIGQLLAHTGGLTAESPGQWWERTPGADWTVLNASLDDDQRKHRPGRRFHYSNAGFGVLGELVARLRGMSWLDALREEILAPLGQHRTTPHPEGPHAAGFAVHPYADVLLPEPSPDAGAMAPAGQLWSTVTDLARWVRFVGGDTAGVLHPDTVAEMREPAIVDDGDVWQVGYGLGFQLVRAHGRRFAGHTGSMPGFLACALIDPATGTGGLVMANTTSGVPVVPVTLDLIQIVDDLEPVLPAEWIPATAVNEELLALTGPWYWGPSPFTLRLLGDGWLDLAPTTGSGRASRFRPDGTDAWIGLDGYYAGETLRLVRGADGAPSHFDLATFIFTRTPYDPNAPIPGGTEGWRGTAR
ncbi:CubicO group peptidase (beta-lactamase class C family) [Tamaricihabitans halophyticus]|uniref:CubicO group peptidase (Beta-lactamase class C family) n=1 Tax=Tamaricihabitans halophyticus TaxID=1262583 RepID=A0A4R2R470_9PSEU|nr:serine hydrolase domain-containing protein [Tamaricihabitans halophyticus]TCP56539.1 CubicO group peptidase (beta-lactamase class C family) [Tamaricihabitans halophyticus]